MLINSVLLSLNQLLPLAILYIMLYVLSDKHGGLFGQMAIAGACLVGVLLYVDMAPEISELADYQGLEISQMASAIFIYVFALYGVYRGFSLWQMAATMLCATLLYFSHYITFLAGFWSGSDSRSSLMIGTLLGIGICVSFSLLLYFSLKWLVNSFGKWPLILLFSLHISAKLVMALDRASGIDFVGAQPALFDLRAWLSEDSELGRILTALIGFEATPSALGLGIYLAGTVVVLLFSRANPGFYSERIV